MASKDLEQYGYLHCRDLTAVDRNVITPPSPSSVNHVPDSLCVYYDLVVDDHLADTRTEYDAFYNVITSSRQRQATCQSYSPSPQEVEQRRFIKNDERRSNLISEFVVTEDNYVTSLRSFVSSIVRPIRSRARDKQRCILGPYECSKIFMNVEQILPANEAFRLDLMRYQSTPMSVNFGDMCLMHMRHFATCYRRFLLGVENAQAFNMKEQKHNTTYEAFLNKLKADKDNQTVYDYLALPVQRVGRYTLFLKELIKHTIDSHADLAGLTEALKTAEEIANMSEDHHTRLIKIFHNMLQSIQNCPASLISQQRNLICHLDAVEHEQHTEKPAYPVTLFLFTDKLMVARRPSYNADGLELCGLDQERDKSGMMSLLARKAELSKRYDRKLKFQGWVSLSDVEIHDGVTDIPGSFSLVTTATEDDVPLDIETHDALEGYFLKGSARLFSIPATAHDGGTKSVRSVFQERQDFVEQLGKYKLRLHCMDNVLFDWTCCLWKERYFFANVYRLSSYHMVQSKNEIALVYIQDLDSPTLISALSSSYMIPHMLGVVKPVENYTHIISIHSKLALGCTIDGQTTSDLQLSAGTESETRHFRDCLLGNLYACDKDLREVGQMANSPSTLGQRRRYADQTKTGTSALRKDLRRKRSLSTSFKLLTGLGSSPSLLSPALAMPLSSRRRSMNPDDIATATRLMESRSLSTYSATSSSGNDSTDQEISTLSLHQGSKRGIKTVRRKSLSESIASMCKVRPGVHPAQTISHELTQPGNRASNPILNRKSDRDMAEEGVKQTRNAVRQQLRDMPPGLSSHRRGDNSWQPSTIRNRFNRNGVASGCRKSWSGPSIPDPFSSCNVSSTPVDQAPDIAPDLVPRNNSNSIGVYTSFPHDLLGTEEHAHVDEKVTELLAHIKSQSPVSSASSESCQTPPPPPTATHAHHAQDRIDELMSEMDIMKSEFNRKYSNMVQDYEEMGAVVRQLTCELRKRDEEVATLRVQYRDCMRENDRLYEAFNSELDHMFDMFSNQPQQQTNDSVDTEPRPQQQHLNRTHADTSGHPSAEMQIRRKLEITIKERNRWHQEARKLRRELQSLTPGPNVDIPVQPSSSISSPSSPNARR